MRSVKRSVAQPRRTIATNVRDGKVHLVGVLVPAVVPFLAHKHDVEPKPLFVASPHQDGGMVAPLRLWMSRQGLQDLLALAALLS